MESRASRRSAPGSQHTTKDTRGVRAAGRRAASKGERGALAEAVGGAGDYDLERLERVVAELAEAYERLRTENAELRSRVEERENRVRRQDAELKRANQKRRDAIESLDRLLMHVDRLEAGLPQSEVRDSDAAPASSAASSMPKASH